jgi:membrane protease YdiL (CAAX protease family)
MTHGPLDHVLAAAFGVGFPILAYVQYERRRPALEADAPGVRIREYSDTIAWLGGMGLATVVVWAMAGRPWGDLGLGWPRWNLPSLVVLAAVAAAGIFFAWQLRLLRTDARAREMLRAQAAHVDEYLPRDPQQGRVFNGVAVGAGIGEELFFRGFLTWYLGEFLPPIAAIGATAAAFASAHLMHGIPATLRAGLMGLLFSGMYAWTGSLYGPMILHTLVDWFAGRASLAGRSPVN